jgi:5-hydroxyisourate hydrolase
LRIGMGRLTTHILDTAHGRPAVGVLIELRRDPVHRPVATAYSNADGRCNQPLLEGPALLAGEYELLFHIGDYYRSLGMALADPPFLDRVGIRFGIASPDQHYHVPLLVSPWSYSTYRGS